jgi:hypothetical protein
MPIILSVVAALRSFPSEPKFLQKLLSIKSKFVLGMHLPLVTNPLPKKHVFLVLLWHATIAILLFKLDQLFILILPCCAHFPSEPKFVQKYLSIKSKCVFAMIDPLPTNPTPKRRVFLVPSGHEIIAILSFKLDQLFILLIPHVIMIQFRHGCFVAFCLLQVLKGERVTT